jgi:hypothetical protein
MICMLSTVRNVFGLKIAKRQNTKARPMIGPSVERNADQSNFLEVTEASEMAAELMRPP